MTTVWYMIIVTYNAVFSTDAARFLCPAVSNIDKQFAVSQSTPQPRSNSASDACIPTS